MMTKDPTAAYAAIRNLYVAYASQLEHLLKAITSDGGVTTHIIESRAKTVESFAEKIVRDGKAYNDPLNELPDLCGCRIIVYYADDVQKVAELLKNEFYIEEEELSHQPSGLDADRFGYLSAHYVVKLNEARAGLTEWRAYDGFRAEIQIRTVIQHAWSAVSHAIQYKQGTAVPSALQRRLYRIAGLFELADEEFVGIREQRSAMKLEIAESVAKKDRSLTISPSSLQAAISNLRNAEEISGAANDAGFNVVDASEISFDDDDTGSYLQLMEIANRAGIRTIQELLDKISAADLSLFQRIMAQDGAREGWTVSVGFLVVLLLLQSCKSVIDKEYLKSLGWSPGIADRVIGSLK